jgi:hypothetical protein
VLFYSSNGVCQANLEDYGVVNGMVNAGDADYLNAARNGAAVINQKFGRSPTRLHKHAPYALRKSVLEAIERDFPKEVAQTRAGQFRSSSDLSIASFLFHHYGYQTRSVVYSGYRAKLVKATAANLGADFGMLKETSNIRTFCLNDGVDSGDDNRWNDALSSS